MGTYKVIQDVEADDKLVGPFSLRQFIYLAIAGLAGWLSFISLAKGIPYILILTGPIIIFAGFLAFPWGKDQPTELWLLAKLRFFLKPHKRIWDQSGAKNLVTITVPKKIERRLTNGLTQAEVRSRLGALANTIDSRGWAIKNVNVNVGTMVPAYSASDRLVDVSTMPQEVNSIDITASDDMLDASANPVAHQFDTMIAEAENEKRQALMSKMTQPPAPEPALTPVDGAQPTPDYWFLNAPSGAAGATNYQGDTTAASDDASFPLTDPTPIAIPTAAMPTEDDAAFLAAHKVDDASSDAATSRLKTIKTPEQIAEETAAAQAEANRIAAEAAAAEHRKQAMEAQKAQVTSAKQAAIINLARTDDQDIATLGRRAQKEIKDSDDGEVVIALR